MSLVYVMGLQNLLLEILERVRKQAAKFICVFLEFFCFSVNDLKINNRELAKVVD